MCTVNGAEAGSAEHSNRVPVHRRAGQPCGGTSPAAPTPLFRLSRRRRLPGETSPWRRHLPGVLHGGAQRDPPSLSHAARSRADTITGQNGGPVTFRSAYSPLRRRPHLSLGANNGSPSGMARIERGNSRRDRHQRRTLGLVLRQQRRNPRINRVHLRERTRLRHPTRHTMAAESRFSPPATRSS